VSRNQKLILVLLAIGDLIVLALLCSSVAYSLTAQSRTQVALAPTQISTSTPTRTPIPTWTPTPTSTPAPPTPTPRPLTAEEAAALDQIEREVATLRGLAPLRPVPRWKITRAELRRHYADSLVGEEWEEEARSLALVLAAFDFIPAGTDLTYLWQDVVSEEVAGFYLTETEEIYVVSEGDLTGAVERVIFAHEFGHALQDQHFDLDSLGLEETSQPEYYADHVVAIQSLVEGDAVLIQEQYIERYFTQEDVMELLMSTLVLYSSPSTEDVPLVIEKTFSFPYVYGREFVNALYRRGGWRAVNDAYASPPVSTEQILHPERYLADDEPIAVSLPPLTTTLGSDWRLLYDAPLGEFFLGLYLENELDPSQASPAVKGWGGDHCAVYHDEASGETALALRTAWDTTADVGEFLNAYETYAEARFDHPADQATDKLTCWQGDDALCVAWEGHSVTLVLGADESTVDRVLAASVQP
jgi:hypothetical protein